MEELDTTKHYSRGSEEADVESNSSKLQLNGSKNTNKGRHAPSALNIDVSTLIIPKYKGCGALDTLSDAKGENISTTKDNERVDEAKLSSSLRMFVSKEGSDEEEPQISIDRRSTSDGEEDEVIAIDVAMEHATCGRQCKDCLYEHGCRITIFIFGSLALSTLIIICFGWKFFLLVVLCLGYPMLLVTSDIAIDAIAHSSCGNSLPDISKCFSMVIVYTVLLLSGPIIIYVGLRFLIP